MAKRPRHCSRCGGSGHDLRNCEAPEPEKKEPAPVERRDENGQFAKGCRGNPGGWSKDQRNARDVLRDYIRGKVELEEANTIIDRLLDIIASSDNTREIASCAKLLLEYAYGKPSIEIEHSGTIGIERAREQVTGTIASLAARVKAEQDHSVTH